MSDSSYVLHESSASAAESESVSFPSHASSRIVASSYAVHVRSLCRSFGSTQILRHLNLTVPTGSIYGLLGPSGCGKTTLLKVLTGRLKAHAGSVVVLGCVPGSPLAAVPGSAVGFMPQELALYEEFSIRQNFKFYGRLFGMSAEAIAERERWLLELLHIPASSRSIRQLSGGQQRRVSLACALLHSPPLLLLDEPTVGVDPLLRSRIWSHLRTLSQQGSTIIITTHYIEEARQADYVGFMRGGRILEEGKPDEMIAEYSSRTLEEVFLRLCTRQSGDEAEDGDADDDEEEEDDGDGEEEEQEDEEEQRDSSLSNNSSALVHAMHSPINSSLSAQSQSLSLIHSSPPPPAAYTDGSAPDAASASSSLSAQFQSYIPRFQYVSACTWRNMARFRNNIPALLFVFLLPSIQVILFCIAIGKDPVDLPFAVVNHDKGGNYSELLVSNLHSRGLLIRDYDSEAEALQAARLNTVWGYCVIPSNYTRNWQGLCLSPLTYNDSCVVRYAIDASNEQVAVFIKRSIASAFSDTANSLVPYNLTAFIPLRELQPVYGSESSSFTDFIAPGIIITIAFSQSIGLTALLFVVDAKSGVLDRGWSAGIRASEMMLSHALTQLLILSVQIWILFLFGLLVFHLPMQGSLLLLFVVTLLLAFSGMLYGLVIAAFCTEERQAMQLALGSFFPALLLSGIIWPVEGIPYALRWISLALPTTWATIAGRDVMSRGWGLEYAEVWQGMLIVIAWNIALFLIAASRLRTQK